MPNKEDVRMRRRQFLKSAGFATVAAGNTAVSPLPLPKLNDDAIVQRYLRSPENTPPPPREPMPPPPVAVIALNRMAFGPRPGDVDAFNALGATDEERLANYIDQQLDPTSIDDSAMEARLVSAGYETLNKTRQALWTDHYRGDLDINQPINELERAIFVRAIYSERQLFEVLTHFWHNHFSVNGRQWIINAMMTRYDREVIRANVLGNFRQMLEDVTRSTVMLYYLDNYTNSREGPNENWARELFELHTLGAENYYGVMPQDDVPPDVDDPAIPAGYVDEDVYEATRCFTGWTVANSSNGPGGDTGLFLYRDDWHDRFQKRVLSYNINIPSDQAAEEDGINVLDLVAYHPGTARHICRKLCTRLISDDPPEDIILSAAAVFIAEQQSPDQLKQVVSHILNSEAFRTTWGEKTKQPFEITVSTLRNIPNIFNFRLDDPDSGSFMSRYDDMGQAPFVWPAPNGYPDENSYWQSTTSMLMRWRMLNWLASERDENDNYMLRSYEVTPPNIRSANALAEYWVTRILDYPLNAYDHQQIVDFMAQGRNPDLDLPIDDDEDLIERLRAMVVLICMTPEFQLR